MSTVVRVRRDQRGFTLVELLAALAIIATVMVPITAWGLLSMRQQSELQDRNSTSASSGMLRTYLTGDIASASTTVANGVDCSNAAGSKLTIDGPAPASERTVYQVRTMTDLDGNPVFGRESLWRTECTGGRDLQIVEDVQAVAVTCGAGCPVVTFDVIRREDATHPIKLTVDRRTA